MGNCHSLFCIGLGCLESQTWAAGSYINRTRLHNWIRSNGPQKKRLKDLLRYFSHQVSDFPAMENVKTTQHLYPSSTVL